MELYTRPLIVSFKTIDVGEKGTLFEGEGGKEVPFQARRVYWLYEEVDVRDQQLEEECIVVPMHGKLKVELESKNGEAFVYELHKPSEALWIPASFRRKIVMEKQGNCMCFASEVSGEKEFINDAKASKKKSSQLIIQEGFPETISFPVPLFFRPPFVYRKGSSDIRSFQCQEDKAQALAYFSIKDQEAWSLQDSPFGSVYGNPSCSEELLADFIAEIKKDLVAKGIQLIGIKHYPACYGAEMHDKVLQALLLNGFYITCMEHNQYLPLQTASKKELFDHSKLHLIKKCRAAGFKVSVSSSFDADKWFEMIVRARKLRGYDMTIDLESLRSLSKGNENCYHFFEVKDGEHTISCAIGVEVSPEVMYYYLAADEESYRSYSPMTFLLDHLYSFAYDKGFEILDMGTSSLNGVLNEGLHWFKKSFGSLEQPKFILQWKME